jgi:hypothetical protein
LLAAVLWVARFWHSGEFGLYEDDLTYLPTAAGMSLGAALDFALDPQRILSLRGQGQPISYSFMFLLTNLGWKIGDIHGPYWLGYAIQAINAGLFFALLAGIHSRSLGLVAGLAFVLYSADTTQAYLTLALGFHPSLTFLLLAAHACLSGRIWLAYPLAALMLVTYETPYPVFFAIPLLASAPIRGRLRKLAGHVLIASLPLIGVVIWRIGVGDDRVLGLDMRQALAVPLTHLLQGPAVSLATFLYRPLQALQSLSTEVAAAAAIGSATVALLIARLRIDDGAGRPQAGEQGGSILPKGGQSSHSRRRLYADLPAEVRRLLQLGGVGLVMLALAYPLTFTVRAYALSGRDTRVHSAGVVGAALLVGSLCLLAIWVSEAYGRRKWVAAAVGVWFGLLLGYGLVVQRDYRLAWQYQRQFWSQLVRLLPDVTEGTTILVDPRGLVDPQQIGANYWNLPAVLEQLYDFPKDWSEPPRAVRLAENWEERILARDGMVVVNPVTTYSPESVWGVERRSNTILIETSGGQLRRSAGPVQSRGRTDWLRPVPKELGEPPFAHGFLYRYLVVGRDPAAPAEAQGG